MLGNVIGLVPAQFDRNAMINRYSCATAEKVGGKIRCAAYAVADAARLGSKSRA